MLGYLVRFWEVDQTKKFQYSLMQIFKKNFAYSVDIHFKHNICK